MKRLKNTTQLILVSAILSSFFLTSCSEESLCLTGNGNVRSYDLSLGPFNKVEMEGPINLRIIQGEEQSVQILSEAELYDPMHHYVQNETLKIGYKQNISCLNSDEGAWVVITVPNLARIMSSGISKIESEGELDLDKLTIITSGVAEINLAGLANTQELFAEGEMTVNNFDFSTLKTKINVDGSGNFEVACTEELIIEVQGSANIIYKGDPIVDKTVTGSLNLLKAN